MDERKKRMKSTPSEYRFEKVCLSPYSPEANLNKKELMLVYAVPGTLAVNNKSIKYSSKGFSLKFTPSELRLFIIFGKVVK